MKKKWLIISGILILIVSVTTMAFAGKPINLLVNGWVVKTDVPPQLIDGRVMVPVRWVTEALGAKVDWNEETRSVSIKSPEMASFQKQVKLLQDALAPVTPGEAAEKWAAGVRDRNGALQYSVLSPELRKEKLQGYESLYWVTGTSSPWVKNYEIVKETQTGASTWEYQIRYDYATSTGPAGSGADTIVVGQYENHWYITSINGGNSLF